MTEGIFVGHRDRTVAVLFITKLDETDTERCIGLGGLGRLVWHAVANGGS